MDVWRDQWVRMESRLALETARALDEADKWKATAKNTFSKDYLIGLADGLKRGLTMVEAFRRRVPKNEIEQMLDEMYDFYDEER